MSEWTITYNGVSKTPSGWKIRSDVVFNFGSKEKDTARISTVENFDDVLQWSYDGKISITNPDGVVVFRGFVGDPIRQTDGGAEWVEYPIYNAWWKLERLVFKQTRNMFAGYTTPTDPRTPPTFVQQYSSEVYMGEKADETYQTNGQQVQEVLNWVNECWNPTRRGATIGIDATQDVVQMPDLTDYPSVNIPKSRINDVFCHEAIVNVLRYSPDRAVQWDYTTNPPTMRLIALADADELSITLTASQERRIQVASQRIRQLAGVVIHYKRVSVIDGNLWPELFVDKFPLTTTDFTPDASVHTIDLVGASVTHTKADVKIIALADALGSDADARKAWWKLFAAELTAFGVDYANLTVQEATVDGGISTTTYPNVLLPHSSLADWMAPLGIVATEATVRARVSYDTYSDGGITKKIPSAKHVDKEIHVRVVLTNAVTLMYEGIQHAESAEAVPVGVAEAVYNSVSALQYSGSIGLVGDQARVDIRPGNKLKLIGPTNTYENLLVQKVSIEPHLGRVTVAYGPSATLDVGDRIELQRVGRFRTTYNMPSGRSDGTLAGGASVSLGNQTPKENTTSAMGADNLQAATGDMGSGNTGIVKKEANQTVAPDGSGISATPVIQMFIAPTATGIRDDTKGGLDLRIAHCLGSDGNYHTLTIQEVDVCVDGVQSKTMSIISDIWVP